MRAADGQAVEGAAPAQIVERLLGVLDQATATLSQMDGSSAASASSEAPAPRRFEFVHNIELRPVLERAYTDSRRLLSKPTITRLCLLRPESLRPSSPMPWNIKG